jgi:hypothetical protein
MFGLALSETAGQGMRRQAFTSRPEALSKAEQLNIDQWGIRLTGGPSADRQAVIVVGDGRIEMLRVLPYATCLQKSALIEALARAAVTEMWPAGAAHLTDVVEDMNRSHFNVQDETSYIRVPGGVYTCSGALEGFRLWTLPLLSVAGTYGLRSWLN